MAFIVVMALALFISLVLSQARSFDTLEFEEKVFAGTSVAVVGLTFVSLSLPSQSEIQSSTISLGAGVLLLFCLCLRVKPFIRTLSSFVRSPEFAALGVLVISYAAINGLAIRYHSSPDNFGFASTVGFFTHNFSYAALESKFLLATGLDKPAFIQQSTPLLGSVWQIPDMRLRFASDMVLCVGRLGFPLLAAVFSGWMDATRAFPSFLIAYGLIGVWFCGLFLFRIAILVARLLSDLDGPFQKIEKEKRWNVKLFVVGLIASLAPWATIFVLEGTLNQLWLLLTILFQMKLILQAATDKTFAAKGFFKNALLFSVAPLMMSVIYANGFLLFAIVLGPCCLVLLKAKRTQLDFKRIIAPLFLGTLTMLPLTLYLLWGTFVFLFSQVFAGVAGAPYSIGVPKIFELMPLLGFKLKFASLGAPSTPTGFDRLSSDFEGAKIVLAIFISFIVAVIGYQLWASKARFHALVLGLVPLGLIWLTINSLSKPEAFNSYLYIRHIVNFVTLGFPILCGLLVGIPQFHSFVAKKSDALKKIFLTASVALALANFFHMTQHFFRSTRDINILNSAQFDAFDLSNSVLVSSYPDIRVLMLTLSGPVIYLTDTWGARLQPDSVVPYAKDVYAINCDQKPASFKKLGRLWIDRVIQGPITSADIVKLPNFQPALN